MTARAGVTLAIAAALTGQLLVAPAQGSVSPANVSGRPPMGRAAAILRARHHLTPFPRYETVAAGPAARVFHRPQIPVRMLARPTPPVVWPVAGTATVNMPSHTARRAGGLGDWVQAAHLPVSVGAVTGAHHADARGATVSRVRVAVAGHAVARAVGAAGMAFAVSRADGVPAAGRVRVRVDYSGFASAYGGGFGARLQLVEVPPCALTTPGRAVCRAQRQVGSVNDFAGKSLTAQVTVPAAGTGPGAVFVVTSSTSGGTGDFKATSLKPSALWQVGLQAGDFTWSYPLRVPPPMGGAAPSLALAYDSGSIDGETAQTNSQPGQLGEGFSLSGGGFIERRYASCADHVKDTSNNTGQTSKTGDLCWDGDNAYLTLNGQTTQLIQDATSGHWRLASDDGSTMRELTGANNGAYQGQYWELITSDGTQYIFGENQLPGWASGDTATNSAWTVPVVGLKAGDPCNDPNSYSGSVCPNMAWRWNLDLVVDPNGNATEYFYNPETSYYAFNSYSTGSTITDGTPMQYTTGGTLASIGYGSLTPNVYNRQPFQVEFGYSDRCTLTTSAAKSTKSNDSTCDSTHTNQYWPDTPWDLYCAAKSGCSQSGHEAPSFFDTQMLTSVTTQVYEGSGPGYVKVDTWDLAYTWLSAVTNDDLFLTSITHTGDVGGGQGLGPVTFTPTEMINRVPGDGYAAMGRYRIDTITSETGGEITVSYNTPDCGGKTRPDPANDQTTCFQQFWAPDDIGGAPFPSWFYKYTVSKVVVSDTTGGEPVMPTYYTYNNGNSGGAAWHYDTDIDLVQPKYKSYSQWRGYEHVSVVTGGTTGTQSETDYTFMRGMDNDPIEPGNGGFTSASVTDSRGVSFTDSQRANGFLLEKITYDGPGGAMVSDQINRPWLSPPTATSTTQPWGGTLTAVLEGTARTDTYAPAVSGTRHTESASTFDNSTGLVTQTDDQGDVSVPAQELCTTDSYAQNTALAVNMVNYPSEVQVTSGPCGASSPPLVSDTRYLYDGGAFGAAPTNGNITETEVYSSGDPGAANHWVKQSRDGYDTYGRVTSSQDAANNMTTTTYSSSYGSGWATTKAVVTDPLTHVTTTDINPEWGSPADVTDPNGETTSYAYDPLGRVTGIWLPGQAQGTDPANYSYAYNLPSSTNNITVPSVATTQLINASSGLSVTSYEFFDSLLRPRQTQKPAEGVGGGSEVTDTLYDSRGNTVTANGPYPANILPSTTLFPTPPESNIPNETASSYDGANRLTEQDLDSLGKLQWKTSYAYPGIDAVTVTPPSGGTAETTYTDARGQKTDIYQYHSATPPATPPAAGTGSSPGAGGWDHTSYTYSPADQLTGITDPAGNSWAYGYDLLGRQITATTPDSGTTTSTYNDMGQLTSATDARGKTISYTYDADGRKTFAYDTSGGVTPAPANELDAWTYDTPAVGQLASAISYVGGTSGQAYQETINNYDPQYHPTSTTYNIPSNSVTGSLAGSYKLTAAYNVDGTIANVGYPSGGGLQAETVYQNYDNLGTAYSLWGAWTSSGTSSSDYVEASSYAPDYQPAEYDLGTSQSAKWSRMLYSYDAATARLTEASTQQETSTTWSTAADTSYSYDHTGNVTEISDSVSNDTQCLQYDYAARLTAAWSQTPTTCPASPPGAAGIGGPAPYKQQFTYDTGGAGNVTKDALTIPGTVTDTALSYPTAGSSQPHASTSATTTVNGTATTSPSTYTASGQVHTTGTGTAAQTFSWNTLRQMLSATDGSGDSTAYRYDANGNLLVRQDNGTSTLYLPGEELSATGNSVTATRYYTHNGQVVAARTPAGVSWLAGDPHGTDSIAIDTTKAPANALSQRFFTPFGTPRGVVPASWPGDHGFVGGTTDNTTGLTNLGAREYNPTSGLFLSPDPILTPYNPQDLNPYAYVQGNPATNADPTGLLRVCYSNCDPGSNGNSGNGGNGNGGNGGSSGGAAGSGNGGSGGPGVLGDIWNYTAGTFNGIVGPALAFPAYSASKIAAAYDTVCNTFAMGSCGGIPSGSAFSGLVTHPLPIGDPNSTAYKWGYYTGPVVAAILGTGAGFALRNLLAKESVDAGLGAAITTFDDRTAARQAFSGDMQLAANRFFRGATAKSQDFQVADLGDGQYQMQFFSPARNPGYGKLYTQTIDESGGVVSEYKDTLGPDGLIERKWISGGP